MPGPKQAGPDPITAGIETGDPLARFRSWRGFLLAALAVNVLFAYAMLGLVADASLATWYKALIWLPFNSIATAVYYAIMMRLSGRPDGAVAGGAQGVAPGRVLYVILCSALIAANWILLLTA